MSSVTQHRRRKVTAEELEQGRTEMLAAQARLEREREEAEELPIEDVKEGSDRRKKEKEKGKDKGSRPTVSQGTPSTLAPAPTTENSQTRASISALTRTPNPVAGAPLPEQKTPPPRQAIKETPEVQEAGYLAHQNTKV